MAVIAGKSPIVMTAVGDSWPPQGSSERLALRVTAIRAVTAAAAGTVRLLDVPGGSHVIYLRTTMPANESDTVQLEGERYEEVYLDALPAGAFIFLYYE